MAYETLVAEIREVFNELASRGDLTLGMLVSNPWAPDGRWDVVASATWMDDFSEKKAIELIIRLLRKHVRKGNWPSVFKVSVLKTDDPFVRSMYRLFPDTSSDVGHRINNLVIEDIEVPSGIVFESHQPKALSGVGR